MLFRSINGPDEVAADAWGTATLPIYEQATAAIGAGIVAGDNVGLKPGTFTFAKGYPGFHVLTSPTSGRADVVYRAPPNLFWIEIAGEISYSGAEIPHVEARRLSWQTDNDDYEQINEAITLYFPGAPRDNDGDFFGLPIGREKERFAVVWNAENRRFEAISPGCLECDIELTERWHYYGVSPPWSDDAKIIKTVDNDTGDVEYATKKVTVYNPYAPHRKSGEYLWVPYGYEGQRYTARWDAAGRRLQVVGPQQWRIDVELGQTWTYTDDVPTADAAKVYYWDGVTDEWSDCGSRIKCRLWGAPRDSAGKYVGIPIGRTGQRYSGFWDPDSCDVHIMGPLAGLIYPATLSYAALARDGEVAIDIPNIGVAGATVVDKSIIPSGDPIQTHSNLIVAWSEALGKFVWISAECTPGTP